jgi:hypothetical protein
VFRPAVFGILQANWQTAFVGRNRSKSVEVNIEPTIFVQLKFVEIIGDFSCVALISRDVIDKKTGIVVGTALMAVASGRSNGAVLSADIQSPPHIHREKPVEILVFRQPKDVKYFSIRISSLIKG